MLGQPIMLIFTILSALQIYTGLKRIGRIRTHRAAWIAEPMMAWKKQLGNDIAFYAAVPIGVLIHELGHAVIVWVYGGKVVEFGYFFFWGFVLPDRAFAPAWKEWLLSAAGTMGSLLFATVVGVLFWRHSSSAVRYAGKRTVRYQIYFSLIYYPLFTAVLSFGDWRTMYDFNATPLLAGGTAAVHAIVLLGFWITDKRGWFDETAFGSAEIATRYATLADSDQLSDKLERVRLMLASGSNSEAGRIARDITRNHPSSGEAHMLLALSKIASPEQVSGDVARLAEKALSLGLDKKEMLAWAHYFIGTNHRTSGRTREAIDQYGLAISAGHAADAGGTRFPALHTLYYMRAIAYIMLDQFNESLPDQSAAIQLAEAAGHNHTVARYREEFSLLTTRQ